MYRGLPKKDRDTKYVPEKKNDVYAICRSATSSTRDLIGEDLAESWARAMAEYLSNYEQYKDLARIRGFIWDSIVWIFATDATGKRRSTHDTVLFEAMERIHCSVIQNPYTWHNPKNRDPTFELGRSVVPLIKDLVGEDLAKSWGFEMASLMFNYGDEPYRGLDSGQIRGMIWHTIDTIIASDSTSKISMTYGTVLFEAMERIYYVLIHGEAPLKRTPGKHEHLYQLKLAYPK